MRKHNGLNFASFILAFSFFPFFDLQWEEEKKRYYITLNNVALTWDIVPFEYAAVNGRRPKRLN